MTAYAHTASDASSRMAVMDLGAADFAADAGGAGGRLERATAEAAARRVSVARQLYRMRRRRDSILGERLFGDAAWDLFLDLFIAHHEARRVCVTSACIAASAPTTTSLRCVRKLERLGLLLRERDGNDGRRSFLRLADEVIEALETLLDETHDRFCSLGAVRTAIMG